MWTHSLYNNEYKRTNTRKGALKVQVHDMKTLIVTLLQ